MQMRLPLKGFCKEGISLASRLAALFHTDEVKKESSERPLVHLTFAADADSDVKSSAHVSDSCGFRNLSQCHPPELCFVFSSDREPLMWASITDPSIDVRIRAICCSAAWMNISPFTKEFPFFFYTAAGRHADEVFVGSA